MKDVDVILFNPPYYRHCGSHNNRTPLSLFYLSRFLEEAGISHVIINGDATQASSYWSYKVLFENYSYFVDAVQGKSPLYLEMMETLMSWNPKTVVVLGADPLFPTKDLGHPYIAAEYSKRLRSLGVKTIGLSPYFNLQPEKFRYDFDTLLMGEPSPTLVDIIQRNLKGLVQASPLPLNKKPLFSKQEYFHGGDDAFLYSLGCLYPCKFCVAGIQYRGWKRPIRFIKQDVLISDLKHRKQHHLYWEDLNFSNIPLKNLESLANQFELNKVNKSFTIECRTDGISKERLTLAKQLGVRRIKLGVENITEEVLKDFKKKQSLEQIQRAVDLIRQFDMEVVIYLLVGGKATQEDYKETADYIYSLKPDHVVVSIWAFELDKDYRYDTQFSPLKLKEWGMPREVFFNFLDLASSVNPTVGKILEPPHDPLI